MLVSLGADRVEGAGSRVRFDLNGVSINVHRPHPRKEAKPYVVRNVRDFLLAAGVVDG